MFLMRFELDAKLVINIYITDRIHDSCSELKCYSSQFVEIVDMNRSIHKLKLEKRLELIL